MWSMNPKGGMPEVVRRASFYLHTCAVGAICVCLFKPNTDATLLVATTTTTLVWDGGCNCFLWVQEWSR